MVISFSPNIFIQISGIIRKSLYQILFFCIWGLLVYILYHFFDLQAIAVPISAVSILGGALAFFLAFRNHSAYDRWWEARKIWGGIVNVSRSFAGFTTNFIQIEGKQVIKSIVLRHLAWINALRIQLREQDSWDEIYAYLSEEDIQQIKPTQNKATQILQKQIYVLTQMKRNERIDEFEHKMLMDCITEMYALQGKAERIKKTVFPYYYVYFTRFFLWAFILFLPLALVPLTGWHSIPLSVVTSFVFFILERTGAATIEPLNWNSSGTPMTTLCRVIEIDVLQQMGESEVPEARKVQVTRNGSLFLD